MRYTQILWPVSLISPRMFDLGPKPRTRTLKTLSFSDFINISYSFASIYYIEYRISFIHLLSRNQSEDQTIQRDG